LKTILIIAAISYSSTLWLTLDHCERTQAKAKAGMVAERQARELARDRAEEKMVNFKYSSNAKNK
tara:strand:- start:6741 stop:6935 length:195 start_codon:yes stop_codon:yes gene_type:complete